MDIESHANYTSQGFGSPVLLIHGMAASLSDWFSLGPQLAAAGYHALAIDLLGHGGSAKPEDPKCYHIENIYRHFTAWLDRLDLEVPPVLVGHSLGGYLSLLHAIRRPHQVRGLVLIDPFYENHQLSTFSHFARLRPGLSEKAMRIAPEWMFHMVLGWNPDTTAHFSPEIRQQIVTDYKRTSPHFVYITQDLPDLTPSLPQLKTPTLVVWGERDSTLRPASFPKLVQTLPYASGYAVPATGHQPHISHSSLINQLVLQFLEDLG